MEGGLLEKGQFYSCKAWPGIMEQLNQEFTCSLWCSDIKKEGSLTSREMSWPSWIWREYSGLNGWDLVFIQDEQLLFGFVSWWWVMVSWNNKSLEKFGNLGFRDCVMKFCFLTFIGYIYSECIKLLCKKKTIQMFGKCKLSTELTKYM